MRRRQAVALAAGLCLVACTGAARSGRKLFEPTIPERRASDEPFLQGLEEADEETPAEGRDTLAAPEPEPEPARARIGDDVPRTLDLRGAPLSEAIHLIASMAGVNVYLDADLSRPVDASFPSIRLDDALSVLLGRNGLRLVEDPPGVYWVARADGSEQETARFQLRSVNGTDVLENLKGLVADDTALVVDRNQNFLMVRGPKRDVDAVADYLAAADRMKLQVLIEVEILEVILDDAFEFGIENLIFDPDFLGEAGLTVVQELSTLDDSFTAAFDLKDSEVTTTINALERYGIVNVISSPRVLSVTNTEADIEVVREIPYIETSTVITSGSGDIGTSSQESVSFKEAGIKLRVTPIVQEGGMVHLAIDQEFSEVIDFFMGIPVLDTRRVVTQFMVQGEETVVIGGLIQDRQVEVDRGIPGLMHLPLLGRLFRSDEDTLQRRELLLLMTPRVLDPEEAARLSTRLQAEHHERVREGGVR